MPNSKKRFDGNPRKRSKNPDNQFRIPIPDESSDMMEAKRVRFEDQKSGINRSRRSRFDDRSEPPDAREHPPMPAADSGGSKTSEFAYFKRLKQGADQTSRVRSVNKESIQMKNFGPAKNGRELGDAKNLKDVKAPTLAKRSPASSFLCPRDYATQSSGKRSKMDADIESSPVIRTPTTIDLDKILSTSATASMNPGIQPKGDIFASKRLKLQRRISQTLFLEADKLQKESDMFVERNLLTWNNSQSDYSPQYKTSSNILKDDVLDEFCNGFDSDESSKFRIRKRSYELPTICYNRFLDNSTRKNYLEYKNDTAGCNSDITAAYIWHPVPFERFGSSSLGDPRDSDELDSCRLRLLEYKSDGSDCKPDTRAIDIWRPVLLEGRESSAIRNSRDSSEMDEFELRSEHIPLLLPWRTGDKNMKASTHLTDMDHELYPSPSWSEDTTLGIHPSTFLASSMLQDHHTKRRHWLQPKDTFARSNNDPLTLLYGPDFRGSHFCVISEDHNHYRGNFKGKEVISAAGALLISQDLNSELSWKSRSLSHGIEHYEQQYDIPTDDACLKVPQSEEEWSWMNVENPAPREVSFPLQLHRIKWLDTAVETNYSGFQIATSDSL